MKKEIIGNEELWKHHVELNDYDLMDNLILKEIEIILTKDKMNNCDVFDSKILLTIAEDPKIEILHTGFNNCKIFNSKFLLTGKLTKFKDSTFFYVEFNNCVFESIHFVEGVMDNVTFNNCTFKDVEIINVRQNLVTFKDCNEQEGAKIKWSN
jgi:uncharacterized protein YjbI with pentapeptide repeats